MFPMVPYHALPKLYELIKEDTPPLYNGLYQAWRGILTALLKQRSDPSYFIRRPLPHTARPLKIYLRLVAKGPLEK
jgi:fatty acid desaturase